MISDLWPDEDAGNTDCATRLLDTPGPLHRWSASGPEVAQRRARRPKCNWTLPLGATLCHGVVPCWHG